MDPTAYGQQLYHERPAIGVWLRPGARLTGWPLRVLASVAALTSAFAEACVRRRQVASLHHASRHADSCTVVEPFARGGY